tara:strand:+ start:389 stop:754 length:366 start_codon:yes stop_codon:yes gene_type:complete
MGTHWKNYGIGQLDSVLLQLVATENTLEPQPTARDLADSLNISLPNLRAAVVALISSKEPAVEVVDHRRTRARGAKASVYGITDAGRARLDAKLRHILGLRFPAAESIDDVVEGLSDLFAA